MPYSFPQTLITGLDGLGSFVFALSGGLLAVEKKFDLFGVLLLSFVVAVSGGITRDLLIGAVPPAAVATWHTLAIAVSAGLLTFYVYPSVQSLRHDILLCDAVGLAVFAVTGAHKALNYGIDPVMAAVLGMVSGIGGGILRDVLAGDVPTCTARRSLCVGSPRCGGNCFTRAGDRCTAALPDAAWRRCLHRLAHDGDLSWLASTRLALAPGWQTRRAAPSAVTAGLLLNAASNGKRDVLASVFGAANGELRDRPAV